MGSLKCPRITRTWSSIETIALNCLIFADRQTHKCLLNFRRQTNEQTNEQTNRRTSPSRESLACTSCLIDKQNTQKHAKTNSNTSELALTNPLIATLKPQSSGPSHSNTAVDGWAVTFGTARRGLGGAAAHPSPSSLYQITAHPSAASVPTSYYSM